MRSNNQIDNEGEAKKGVSCFIPKCEELVPIILALPLLHPPFIISDESDSSIAAGKRLHLIISLSLEKTNKIQH